MSQTFFSKLDLYEKNNRLSQIGNSRGEVLVWEKGSKEKKKLSAIAFDKDQQNLVFDTKLDVFKPGTKVLCSFELRGMVFFSECIFRKSVGNDAVLEIHDFLFKAEKRSSYRLLTFPIHEVWVELDLSEVYEGGNVVNIKSKSSETALFKNFLNIVKVDKSNEDLTKGILRMRVQDISATGLALHIGELETKYFPKDHSFKNVRISFIDQEFIIPEVNVVYVVDYISADKNLRKYKVGMHFSKNSNDLDTAIGKKINQVIREADSAKDFEKLLK